MRSHLTALLFSAAAVCGSTSAHEELDVQNGPITVNISCRDNPQCILTKDGIELDITIRNSSGQPVALPFAYINKTGPMVEFVDNNDPKRRGAGRLSVPRPELLTNLTQLAPGQTLSMSYWLSLDAVANFTQDNLCFTTTVKLLAPTENRQDFVNFGTGQVVIRGEPR